MFNHILLLKLKNKEDKKLIIKEFMLLKEKIQEIQEIEISENIYLKRESNFDIFVKLSFNNEIEFEKYLFDPIHTAFVKDIITNLVNDKSSIDF